MAMKKNARHGILPFGCFYAGVRKRRRKNGLSKVGKNEKADPKGRAQVIRNKGEKDFEIWAYIRIQDCTKARLEFVESYARMLLEDYYTNIGTDHFEVELTDRVADYQLFVDRAIEFGVKACNMMHFTYEVIYEKR